MPYHLHDDLLWPWMLVRTRRGSRTRVDVLFRVLYAPDDDELQRPLWNPGAEFTTRDVAGMLLDGGLSEGSRLRRYVDRTEWTVRDHALEQINGSRRLVPVETNQTDRVATLREVTV